MGLRSLKQRFAKRLSISGSSSSSASTSSAATSAATSAGAASSNTSNTNTAAPAAANGVPGLDAGTGLDAPGGPPAYKDVPVFANPLPREQIPFLPYELITEIIYWAITPAFDEYRQHDSAIHVQTLHNLAAVSPAFLSIVRRICAEAPEIPVEHRCVPCREFHYRSVCTFETAAAWMPISVLAGLFTLNIFDTEKFKSSGKTVARIQGFQPNLTALIFLLWNRQAMERMPGVPRHSIFLAYPAPFARHNHHRSINKFNIVLKALANCRHLRFSYVRLSVPALNCSARLLLDAVTTIAPTRYLEVDMQILAWGGDGGGTGEEEHPALPGFSAKLPLEILTAGLRRGASRVDIGYFRLDDQPASCRTKEIMHSGSLVNFIRARTIPDGVVQTEGGSVFAQLVIGGPLDKQPGGGISSSGGGISSSSTSKLKGWRGVGSSSSKVVVNPFKYSLTAVRDGQREWMGDGQKFAANHFLDLAVRDGEDVGTAERRRIEQEWQDTL
ncbi:hypothetical protein TWF696_003049 [Orbilia brochopaga]|uniref:Uncharacterized protein n=1 Tax=Orbilia brochopaga TaxID=3140254 RepID=A0AAV9U1Q9_9PEZI